MIVPRDGVIGHDLGPTKMTEGVAAREDFDFLYRLIQQQVDRCESLRRWGSAIIGFTIVLILVSLLVFHTYYELTSHWGYLYPMMIVPPLLIVSVSPALLHNRRELRFEREVLSRLLAMIRETGPALLHVGDISPYKWEIMKIELSRYGI